MGGLNVVQAFTSVAIISLMTAPAAELLQSIPSLGMAKGCFDRTQMFSIAESWEDARRAIELADGHETESLEPASDVCVAPKHRQSTNAILVREASVKPTAEAAPIVREATFAIKRGSFTMLIRLLVPESLPC